MATTLRSRGAAAPLLWFAALLALLFAAATPTFANNYDDDVDVSTFYDELEGDGDWVEHPQYGYVWTPAVDDDWRPYTLGHWNNTEEHGWYWESDEPFGWAVYHYGRWGYDDDLGWFWVPGRKWGPAWVDWRHSDDEIGWRPLGPDEDWEPSGGVSIRASYYDEPRYAPRWIFVSPRYFAEPVLHVHLFPRTQSVIYLGRTRRITTYTVVNRRVVNSGISITFVQRYAPRPLVTRRITVTDTRIVRRPGTSTTVINVYRPKALRTTTTTTTVRLTKPKTVVNKTVIVQKKQTIRATSVNRSVKPAPASPIVKQGGGSAAGADAKEGLSPKERRALNKAKQQSGQGPAGTTGPAATAKQPPPVAKVNPQQPVGGGTGPGKLKNPDKQGPGPNAGGQNAGPKKAQKAAQQQGPGAQGPQGNAKQKAKPDQDEKKKKKNQQNQP